MSKHKKKHGKVYNNDAFKEGWDRIFGLENLPESIAFKTLRNPRFRNSKTLYVASAEDFDTVPLVDDEDTHLEVKASHGKG